MSNFEQIIAQSGLSIESLSAQSGVPQHLIRGVLDRRINLGKLDVEAGIALAKVLDVRVEDLM